VKRKPRLLLGVAGLIVASLVGACVDRGGTFVAENKTDDAFIARITGKDRVVPSAGESADWHQTRWRQDVVVLPAHSRVPVVVLGFTDTFNVWTVEVLASDCSVVATFDQDLDHDWSTDGILFVIEPGPSVTQRREWPMGGTRAPTADRCRRLPPDG
jgi:hypothetical protein